MNRAVRSLKFARAVKHAVTAFAVTGAAIVGWQQVGAQVFGGHNSNAPVNYAADRIELQGKQSRVVLSGNVDINQGDLRMQAARTNVAYTNENELQIQRIDATGGVVVTRGTESARGDVAVYDFNKRIITMAGNVGLRRGGTDTLNGGRLVINLQTGVSTVDGGGGGGAGSSAGRVSGTFAVPKQGN
jgi:lipopolysaccharide export system protein LptA